MKEAVSSVFHKVGSLFGKVGSLFRRAGFLFYRVGSLFGKAGLAFSKIGGFFRSAASLLGRPIRELRLLPPFLTIDRALHRTPKVTGPPEYRFLSYVTSVLRVLGWAVLIIGVLASILFGLEIMNGGLMVGETQLRGAGLGASATVLGMVGSFLVWLLLLVSRELICLFIQVKENTRNTAGSIGQESG
jgi:hypothetical protein